MSPVQSKIYRIPILETDEQGIAVAEYKIANKNNLIYVNIQGLSDAGVLGYDDFIIEPKKNGGKNRKELD
jgi:hypothetical protein